MNPVHKFEGTWWFWNETWADRVGPFSSRRQAENACNKYAKSLDTGDEFVTEDDISESAREMAAELVSENSPEFEPLLDKIEEELSIKQESI